jgi:hypothetical protein
MLVPTETTGEEVSKYIYFRLKSKHYLLSLLYTIFAITCINNHELTENNSRLPIYIPREVFRCKVVQCNLYLKS